MGQRGRHPWHCSWSEIAPVLTTTIATRWFTKQRGLVLGLLSAGTATGQLIFLLAAAWLTEHQGLRMALFPSAIMVGLVALAFFLFARDYPSDVGLPPYGEDKVLPTSRRLIGTLSP